MCDVGSLMLNVGCWMLDAVYVLLQFVCCKFDVGGWRLGVGSWMLDVGCRF